MSKRQKNTESIESAAIEWLTLLQSSAMTKTQENRFFEWLESDPRHQQAFIKADELWQRGAALQPAFEKTQSKSRKFQFNFNFFGFQNKTLWLGSGLGIACTLAVILIINPSNDDSLFQHYETLAMERKTVELMDGSTATLNINSALTVDFSESQYRNITIERGEVFFKVSHNPKRPFKVHTHEGEITVLGTQFSVESNNQKTDVTVLSGRVQVAAKNSNSESVATEVLQKNQHSTVQQGKLTTNAVDAQKALAWREGMLHFEGATLSKVVQELNRYYSAQLNIGNDEIANLKVIAVFPLTNTLEEQIELLESSLNIVAAKDPATGTVRFLPAQL